MAFAVFEHVGLESPGANPIPWERVPDQVVDRGARRAGAGNRKKETGLRREGRPQ